MDTEEKLDLLAPAARFEVCDAETRAGQRPPRSRAPAAAAGLLRVLMSSRCVWNCAYCPLRAGNDLPRAALDPAELAQAFEQRTRRGAAQGLFLSSAIDGSVDHAMHQMLDAVELIRRQGFQGYVHLKLLPGAAYSDIERASVLADRLSLNLDAPSAARLARVAPQRNWDGDMLRLAWARDFSRAKRAVAIRREGPGGVRGGLATQLVVGAADESDREVVTTSTALYAHLRLRRVYYGAFRPAPGTPLEHAAPTPFLRSQRLGQADWLLRHYGFDAAELPFDDAGNLPLGADPKLAWALAHPAIFPVEINRADPEVLLRVPGIGPLAQRRILRLRALYTFRDPDQLRGTGARPEIARDFLAFDGRFFGRSPAALISHYLRPAPPEVEQLTLF